MPTGSSCIPLFGTTVAFVVAFGASIAQSAPIMAGPAKPRLTEAPIPIADVKAGVNAGGLAGADVDASLGGGKGARVGVGASVGSDARAADAKVDADVDAGAKASSGGAKVGAGADAGAMAGAGGAKADADVHSGAKADAGRAKVGADANAGAMTGAGGARADVDVDAGTDASAGGAKVSASVDGGAKANAVDADVNAGAKADAQGAKIGASLNARAEAGGAKVGAGVNAAADAATGAVQANGGVGANAGGATVGARASVAAGGGTDRPVGLNTDISAGLSSDPAVRETSASGSEMPGNGTVGARTTLGVPALAQTVSSILLPILPPLEGHRGDDAGSIEPRETQLAMLGCIDPLSDGSCPAEPKAIPQSSIQFEIVDAADGATNTTTSTIVQPPHAVGPTYPQPAAGASQSFGISLADPVRTKNVLVVRCIIFNVSAQNQPIPRLDVRLLNSAGETVGQSELSAPSDALAGGQEKTFTLRIQSLPPHATRLTVSFVSPT